MVFVPFIYFFIVFLLIFRRRGLDVSAIMALIYTISTLVAIYLYQNPKGGMGIDYTKVELSFIPTILYCSLNSLLIYPFYRFNSNKVRHINGTINKRLFNFVVILYILVFLINLVILAQVSVSQIFLSLAENRQNYYGGEDNIVHGLPYYAKVLYYGFGMFGGCAYFILPFFFYSVAFLNNKPWFNLMILVSSMTPILTGLVVSDRSSTFYWLLMLVLCYFLFKNYLGVSGKKFVIKLISVFGGILIVYFVAVTLARFEVYDNGASGGLLDYIGQSYLNFCEIWNHRNVDLASFGRIFPLSNMLFHHSMEWRDFGEIFESKTGVDIGVFFSAPGLFLTDIGRLASVLITILIFLVTNGIIKKVARRDFSLSSLIVVFIFAAIPQCGVISYFYTSAPRVFCLLFFLLIARAISKRKRRQGLVPSKR